MPRLPYALGTPGETQDQVFEQSFQGLRARFRKITRPEAKVFLWLLDHFGKDSYGVDWSYTPTLAFDYRPDGIEVDFLIYDGNLAWQVQGERFHFGDPKSEGEDQIEAEVLSSEGFTVVNMLESMINQDTDRVCRSALNGEQLYFDNQFLGNASLERAQKVTR